MLPTQTLEESIAEYEELLAFLEGMRTLFMRTRRQEVVSILQGLREKQRQANSFVGAELTPLCQALNQPEAKLGMLGGAGGLACEVRGSPSVHSAALAFREVDEPLPTSQTSGKPSSASLVRIAGRLFLGKVVVLEDILSASGRRQNPRQI